MYISNNDLSFSSTNTTLSFILKMKRKKQQRLRDFKKAKNLMQNFSTNENYVECHQSFKEFIKIITKKNSMAHNIINKLKVDFSLASKKESSPGGSYDPASLIKRIREILDHKFNLNGKKLEFVTFFIQRVQEYEIYEIFFINIEKMRWIGLEICDCTSDENLILQNFLLNSLRKIQNENPQITFMITNEYLWPETLDFEKLKIQMNDSKINFLEFLSNTSPIQIQPGFVSLKINNNFFPRILTNILKENAEYLTQKTIKIEKFLKSFLIIRGFKLFKETMGFTHIDFNELNMDFNYKIMTMINITMKNQNLKKLKNRLLRRTRSSISKKNRFDVENINYV